MPRLSAVDMFKKWLAKVGIKDRTIQAVDSALHEETLHYSRTGRRGHAACDRAHDHPDRRHVIQNADVTRVNR